MPLLLAAVLSGVLTAFTLRRAANPASLRAVRNSLYAHLLEFRLFFDEPLLLWRAQLGLLRDNARLAILLLPPTLILLLPMAWLFAQLGTAYGLRPFRPGEPAIVTAQLTRPLAAGDSFTLQATGGIVVETPAVRVFHDNQVSWRIRPSANGAVQLDFNGLVAVKTVQTGSGPRWLSPRRARSLTDFLLHPQEPRLPASDLDWIGVDYPAAGAGWIIWFLAVSTLAAAICLWIGL